MLVGQVAMSLLPAPSNSTTIEDVMQIPSPATYRIIIFGKVRHALILSLMITLRSWQESMTSVAGCKVAHNPTALPEVSLLEAE